MAENKSRREKRREQQKISHKFQNLDRKFVYGGLSGNRRQYDEYQSSLANLDRTIAKAKDSNLSTSQKAAINRSLRRNEEDGQKIRFQNRIGFGNERVNDTALVFRKKFADNASREINEIVELSKLKTGGAVKGAISAQQVRSRARKQAGAKIGSARRRRGFMQTMGTVVGAIGGFWAGGPAGAVAGAGLGSQIGGMASNTNPNVGQTQEHSNIQQGVGLATQLGQFGFQGGQQQGMQQQQQQQQPQTTSLGMQLQQNQPIDVFQRQQMAGQQFGFGGGFLG